MSKYKILGTFTGLTSKLSNNFESSITKNPTDVLHIRMLSIDNDKVTNNKYHGGDMRVIHHFSNENYNHLKEKFPDISNRFRPGSFGENILTEELTETDLNIGDIYSLGTAKVQLTVCRIPCSTINFAYGDDRILKEVVSSGRTGWFYKVLKEGEVRVGDYLEYLESPYPDLPVSRLYQQGFGQARFSDVAFLERCLKTGLMDKGWAPKIVRALTP